MGSRASVCYLHASPLVRLETSMDGRAIVKEMCRLRTNEELTLIRSKLIQCGLQFLFFSAVANTRNLRGILKNGCRVLHYAGHASDSFLAFESSIETMCGIMEPLEVTPLKAMLAASASPPKLVFMRSCWSEESGNIFVQAGVPHVVIMRGQSVDGGAALHFSDLFYEALISSHGAFTVREAFEIARKTVCASVNLSQEGGDHFLLLPKDGNHDVHIFDKLREGDFIDKTRYPPMRPPCDRAVSSYRGLVGLQKVVKLLVEPQPSCVTITGERGSGKTERAIQACDYVRERHHFDIVHWTDGNTVLEAEAGLSVPPALDFSKEGTGGLDSSDESTLDLCRLIGVAVGMPFPGPESAIELHRFLFNNPEHGGGRPFLKVLLVLDNADALLERRGGSRELLVELLATLCSMGNGECLKLLVTSEHRLLPETHEQFHLKSEVEAKVEPLKPIDASKFLFDILPRNFQRKELGLTSTGPLTDDMIHDAVQTHPELMVLIEEGHPGTLRRLAPTLLDNLGTGKVKEIAARYRDELRAMPRCASRHGRPYDADRVLLDRPFFSHTAVLSTGSAFTPPPLARRSDAGPATELNKCSTPTLTCSTAGSDSDACSLPDFEHPPHSFAHSNLREMSYLQKHAELDEFIASQRRRTALVEPEFLDLSQNEQQAWDAARTSGVVDLGCILVWAIATADASADELSDHHDHDGIGSPPGLVDTRGAARHDCVPWDKLEGVLVEHLSGKLAGLQHGVDVPKVPHDRIGDVGKEERKGSSRAVGLAKGRVLEARELEFLRGILRKRQHLEVRKEDGTLKADMVSVEAFAAFSLWWAPVVRTLSLIRHEWEATDPIRVHGFVGRFWADRALRKSRPGTFLLRFSENELGALVVSFKMHVKRAMVKHCLVTVCEKGCYFVAGPRTISSLRDLVMTTSALSMLYPDTPKEVAFAKKPSPPSTEGKIGGGGGGGGGTQVGAHSDKKTEDGEAAELPRWSPPPQQDFEIIPADDEETVGEASNTLSEEPPLSRGLGDVLPPSETVISTTEKTLTMSLGPGPMTHVSRSHEVEFELQDGSLEEELLVEIAITQGLAFVDCESKRAPSCGVESNEEFLAMTFVHGPEGLTFPEDRPAKLRFFLGCMDDFEPAREGVLDQAGITDDEIERDIIETYRPLTSPNGVENWTTFGEYSVVFRRQLGQREVWVETPIYHFSVIANAIKGDKGGKNQSYFYGDLGGRRWWFKGRSSAPRIRFGNATEGECATFTYYPIVQHTEASSETEVHGEAGVMECTLGGGTRNFSSATGAALPAAGEKITTLVAAGSYEDRDLCCDVKEHLQMHVRVGVLQDMTGRGIKSKGKLQLLDVLKISRNKVLVLREPRLSLGAQFQEVDWPCSAETICKL